jgi:hypothetical protein
VLGTAISERGDPLSVVVVCEDQPWTMREIGKAESGVEFSCGFTFEQLGFNSSRPVVLELFAVDSYGSISSGHRYQSMIIGETIKATPTPLSTKPATPTATVSRSPIASISPRATLSSFPSRSQSPSVSPFPVIQMRSTFTADNFRLSGILHNGNEVRLTYGAGGVQTKYQINRSDAGTIKLGGPVTDRGITIWTNVSTIGPIAIVQFTAVNENIAPTNVSIGLGSDNQLNGANLALIYTLDNWAGFYMLSGAANLTFFCRNYPLTVNTDGYWYGPYLSLSSSFFTMTTEPSFLTGTNGNGITASWRDQTVEPGQRRRFSMVISWKEPNTPPSLEVVLKDPQEFYDLFGNATLAFTGSVADDDNDIIGVYAIVDGDLSRFHPVAANLSSGTSFSFQTEPRSWFHSPGNHVMSFYAIDSEGSISSSHDVPIRILAPTSTPSISPAQTRTMSPATTPRASRTASRSHTPTWTPLATSSPFPYFAARVGTQDFRFEGFSSERPWAMFTVTLGFEGWVNFTNAPTGNLDVRNKVSNTYSNSPCQIQNRAVAIEAAGILMYKIENTGTESQAFHLAAGHEMRVSMPSPDHYLGILGALRPRVWRLDDGTGLHIGEHGLFINLHLRDWPLTTAVDTYNYGISGMRADLMAMLWRMTNITEHEFPSNYAVWSWQNRTIAPRESQILAIVTTFGLESTPPILDLSETDIPSLTYWNDTLHLIGIIEDPDSQMASLLLIYDNDPFEMIVMPERVAIGTEFDLPFRFVDGNIREGPHTLTIYAVDETGQVSNSVSFSTVCIAPTAAASTSPLPTSTISQSPEPTASMSYRMSQTPSDSPTPSASPYVDIEMFVSSDVDSKTNFRIQGIRRSAPSDPIDLSTRGFATRYRVNEIRGILTRMQPVEVEGVQISTVIDTSSTTAVVQFHIFNTQTVPQHVSIGVDTTILIHGDRRAYIYKQEDETGLRVIGGLSHFQVFCRNYPMVIDVDSYWFGPSSSLENAYEDQVNESVFDGEDGAIAFSWRDREIPGRTRVILSAILTWGEGADRPNVQLDEDTPPLPNEKDVIAWEEQVSFAGAIDVKPGVSIENTVIYLVVDGEIVDEIKLDASGKFAISFTPSALRLAGGLHEFRVFAMDTAGSIAPIVTFTTAIEAPTEKQSQTAPPSSSPTASATASASWGEIIEVPWYAGEVPEADGGKLSPITIGNVVIGVGLPVGIILIAAFAFLIHRYRSALRADMTQRLRVDSQTDASASGMGV